MTTIHIKKLEKLTTSDAQDLVYVSGDIVASNFELGTQPSAIAYIAEDNSYKVGQNFKLDDDAMPTHVLYVENTDPWELYGSDHNSGVLWFGASASMDSIHQRVEDTYVNHVGSNKLSQLTHEYVHISASPIVRWDFDDGNSLIISYVDESHHNMPGIMQIHDKDIISYQFGAGIDDRLAHEFLQPYIAKLLKKIKYPTLEIDIDDLGHEDDYPIEVNGKDITSKHNELLLKLAEHLYCSILKAHQADSSDADELIVAFAKKLDKNRLINNLEKPVADTNTHLTYIYDSSNKEYNILFKNENDLWIVETSYGSIGKKKTEATLISTPNIEEAQDVYIALLKDKLTRGYDWDQAPQPKNKVKI